jgi:hypothetical protein
MFSAADTPTGRQRHRKSQMSGKPCNARLMMCLSSKADRKPVQCACLVVAHDDGRFFARGHLAGDLDVLESQRKQVQAHEVRNRGVLQPAPQGGRGQVRRDATGAHDATISVALRAQGIAWGTHSLRQLYGGSGMSAWERRGRRVRRRARTRGAGLGAVRCSLRTGSRARSFEPRGHPAIETSAMIQATTTAQHRRALGTC